MTVTNTQAHCTVQRVWGSVDTILLIFAGSAAEFAVNRAVDWLFATRALPDKPIERFFETVQFAQAIVFGTPESSARAVQMVNRAHKGVERFRGGEIPQWAYRDVLFMLVDYGERAHEIVFGPMTSTERAVFFESSLEIGRQMFIQDLPTTYEEYRQQRETHLREDTEVSDFTHALYESYRKAIGPWRMKGLLDLQSSIVPPRVADLLELRRKPRVDWLLGNYRRYRSERLLRWLMPYMLPRQYANSLAAIVRPPEC